MDPRGGQNERTTVSRDGISVPLPAVTTSADNLGWVADDEAGDVDSSFENRVVILC